MIMEHCIYTLPFEPFTISCPNGVPAHFSCAGTADGFEVRVQHLCSGVFGLGERYDAANYRGKTAVSAVEEKFCRQGDKTYCPMPFFWTDTGLGVYAETARVTRFEFASGDITLHLPAACALHVFASMPEEIVAGYMRLSGQAVLPPKWALGPWISANRWDSREKLENAVAEAQERGTGVVLVGDRDVDMAWEGFTARILAPVGDGGDNERGLVVCASVCGYDAVITGDAGAAVERIHAGNGSLPRSELLVAGHHGSTSFALLDAVRPETVVISVGYNSYGHPTEEAMARMKMAGAEVYRTDENGNVTIRIDENGQER